MTIRCLIDGLLLRATVDGGPEPVTAYDGDEAFGLEAIEAAFYEIVEADREELLGLQLAHFRLLRPRQIFCSWPLEKPPPFHITAAGPAGRPDRRPLPPAVAPFLVRAALPECCPPLAPGRATKAGEYRDLQTADSSGA